MGSRSQGVKSIVTIREEPLADEWIKDVNYLHVMSNDMGVPEFDDLIHAVDFIHRRITNNEFVLVHCLAGLWEELVLYLPAIWLSIKT